MQVGQIGSMTFTGVNYELNMSTCFQNSLGGFDNFFKLGYVIAKSISKAILAQKVSPILEMMRYSHAEYDNQRSSIPSDVVPARQASREPSYRD